MASPTVTRAPSAARSPARGRTLSGALVLAVASLATLVATVRILLGTVQGQTLDENAMESVYARRDTLEHLLSALGYVSIGTMAVGMTVLVGLAVVRGRFDAAIAAAGVLAVANLATQALKRYVIDRPDYGVGWHENSLPSGHTTAAMSMVVAALLVTPAALRFLVTFLGTAAVFLTGVSTVVAGWHRPSDIVAALAICVLCGSVAAFALALRRTARPSGSFGATLLLALLATVAGGVVLLAIGVRPDGGWTGFGPAALVITSIGLATTLAVTLFERVSAAFAR